MDIVLLLAAGTIIYCAAMSRYNRVLRVQSHLESRFREEIGFGEHSSRRTDISDDVVEYIPPTAKEQEPEEADSFRFEEAEVVV